MSLYGAMMIGVSALDAFSNAMSMTSSNIANVNTIGYKSGGTSFSSLVAASMGEGGVDSIGVISGAASNVGAQGLLQGGSSTTDLAISGNGFFLVNSSADMSGGQYYTRAGDFQPDGSGDLRNSAGYYLMGYACGPDGSVSPGTALSAINVTDITGKAEATQNMTIQANLQSSTAAYDDPNTPYEVGDLANGTIPASFTRTINIYDSQGGQKPVTISFLKTGDNTWQYEVSDSSTSDVGLNGSLPAGVLAAGTMTFGTDGTLQGITPNAEDTTSTFDGGKMTLPINWTTGVASQNLTIDFGTIGSANGMSQFDSASTLTNSTVDGAAYGTLAGVTVGPDGIVTAQFTNGLTQAIYQLPLATFHNVNGLASVSGNAYKATANSGGPIVNDPGIDGAGKIAGGMLEGSTVDLATEFTNLITTQRAYEASTRVITTASQMLDELNQLGR